MYKEMIERYDDIKNIGNTLSLLNWDQSTNITKNGVESRAETMATLSKLAHNLIVDDDFYELLININGSEINNLTELQKNEIIKIKEDVEYERKIPSKLVEELTRVTSIAMSTWEIARKENDDKHFLPLLQQIFDLKKQYADYLGYEKNPYDALLDRFDKGLKYDYIKPLFEKLEGETKNLLDKINISDVKIKDDFLSLKYEIDKQLKFGNSILKKMGIDFDSFRQDTSAHPFTTEIGIGDVRITTNISEIKLLKGFYSTVHEGGHALYTLGVRDHFKNSTCGELNSLSLHESQSRFYENILARSKEFWNSNFNEIKKLFPEQLNNVTSDEFYKSVNKVEKSPIRIDADEITYNLHIILRTELENSLLNKEKDVKNINEMWNEKFKYLFGFYPESKSKGYLQDIHWSDGLIGYFPTYTIGNLISAQFYYKMQNEIGKFSNLTEKEFKSIFNWFNKNLYSKGRIYDSFETVKMICNEDLKSDYYLKYLSDKFTGIYN